MESRQNMRERIIGLVAEEVDPEAFKFAGRSEELARTMESRIRLARAKAQRIVELAITVRRLSRSTEINLVAAYQPPPEPLGRPGRRLPLPTKPAARFLRWALPARKGA